MNYLNNDQSFHLINYAFMGVFIASKPVLILFMDFYCWILNFPFSDFFKYNWI